MPRPKGSKNKTTAAQTPTRPVATAKPAAVKHQSTIADPVADALLTYERLLTAHNETVTGLLSDLMDEFETVKDLVNGATPPTTVKGGKTPPKVEPEPEEEGELDFDTMTVEELQDFIEEEGLDVDLDDYKKLSQKRQAVADAYEDLEGDETEDDDEPEDEEEDETETETEDDDDDWDDPPKPASKVKRGRR